MLMENPKNVANVRGLLGKMQKWCVVSILFSLPNVKVFQMKFMGCTSCMQGVIRYIGSVKGVTVKLLML